MPTGRATTSRGRRSETSPSEPSSVDFSANDDEVDWIEEQGAEGVASTTSASEQQWGVNSGSGAEDESGPEAEDSRLVEGIGYPFGLQFPVPSSSPPQCRCCCRMNQVVRKKHAASSKTT